MGIKLDWEIESSLHSTGEDPEAALKRRLARLRLLAFIGVLVVVLGGCVALIAWRLRYVEDQIRQQLIGTVEAEVAALRIGDRSAFLALQHRENADWLALQTGEFDAYQRLAIEGAVELPGTVVDAAIEGERARVQVLEVVRGATYTRVWFYYRFRDECTPQELSEGCTAREYWLHVAPDYSFWGEQQTFTGEGITIIYNAVDTPLVEQMGGQLESWIAAACAALTCDGILPLAVVVVPNPSTLIGWLPDNPRALQMPSPYAARALTNQPFDPNLQSQVANAFATQFFALVTNNLDPHPQTDAAFLRQTVIAWLTDRFLQRETFAFTINSFVAAYGEDVLGRLVRAMQPASDIRVLAEVAGVASLDALNLDWRDYLTWRLTLENMLIALRDETTFLTLYDTRDANVVAAAQQRFNNAAPTENRVVVSVVGSVGTDGLPQLTATVQIGAAENGQQELVLFRLVEGLWRRAS